jgi:hypothetical protein
VINDKILEKDKQACEMILQRMNEEEITGNVREQWLQGKRIKTRQRLINRHEKII